MKANVPKRKVFNDAVDLLYGDDLSVPKNGIEMLPIDSVCPFRNHPFRLYEGERLDDMVESIREHGILNPLIVWKNSAGYEMLAGHNRQNAGRLAGLTERYEKVISQGKRNDILQEIAKLNGSDAKETCGHDVHRLKSRDTIGKEYGMTGRNIARYMRVNQLSQPLKEKLDNGVISLTAAVDLSYLAANEQETVSELAEQGRIKLDGKTVKCIKDMDGEITANRILEHFGSQKDKKAADRSIKLSADVYERYFADTKSVDVARIVEEALAVWFKEENVASVS